MKNLVKKDPWMEMWLKAPVLSGLLQLGTGRSHVHLTAAVWSRDVEAFENVAAVVVVGITVPSLDLKARQDLT